MNLKKSWKSFTYALKGLKTVWLEEHNFRTETIAVLFVTFCIFYFNFNYIESALCVLAMVLVVSAEIVNTTIEDICNKIQPEFDTAIGKIKDMMAAYVLICVTGALILGIIVFINHFVK
jgi:diacylglycerol kinase